MKYTDSELKDIVSETYPHLEMPPEVHTFRPFHEGAIAYYRTRGDRDKAHHGYRKDAFHAKDWEIGWKSAKEYEQRKREFKFMECVA